MLYMLLICESEAEAAGRSAAEDVARERDYEAVAVELTEAGKYRGCGALEPTGTATTVRVRGGKTLVSDGPFAETKEQLGGYVPVDAATWTTRSPSRPACRRRRAARSRSGRCGPRTPAGLKGIAGRRQWRTT